MVHDVQVRQHLVDFLYPCAVFRRFLSLEDILVHRGELLQGRNDHGEWRTQFVRDAREEVQFSLLDFLVLSGVTEFLLLFASRKDDPPGHHSYAYQDEQVDAVCQSCPEPGGAYHYLYALLHGIVIVSFDIRPYA